MFVCAMALTTYFVFVPRILFRTQLVSIQENQCSEYIALRLVKVSNNVTALFACSPEDYRANATCVVPYSINSTVYVIGRLVGTYALGTASMFTLVVFIHLTFACTLCVLLVFCMYSLCRAYSKGKSYAYLDVYEPEAPEDETLEETPEETTVLY